MSETGPTGPTDETGNIPTPEPLLSLDDLLNEQVMKLQKEQSDKQMLETISNQSANALKPTLLQWAMRGFPDAYPILYLPIQPPTTCADGECRTLYDYITYASGKPIEEHVDALTAKLSGMRVSFANIGGSVAIVISKA